MENTTYLSLKSLLLHQNSKVTVRVDGYMFIFYYAYVGRALFCMGRNMGFCIVVFYFFLNPFFKCAPGGTWIALMQSYASVIAPKLQSYVEGLGYIFIFEQSKAQESICFASSQIGL